MAMRGRGRGRERVEERECVREREQEGAGGSVRERTALSDAAQFAKSTSSTLTRRQSSGEQVFSCTNPCSPQPASIFTMAAVASSPSSPRPLLRSSVSLFPSLCLHNATLAEDGKERTHSFRIPPDPTTGSCSWVYHSKTKREKQTQTATLL